MRFLLTRQHLAVHLHLKITMDAFLNSVSMIALTNVNSWQQLTWNSNRADRIPLRERFVKICKKHLMIGILCIS